MADNGFWNSIVEKRKQTYINSNFYKKVYILDFYINSILETTYAFSVPPQSEDFAYAQRIGETKTFGGVILEDYGNDSVKITLSGSTINQEVKCIYTKDGSLKTYSGYEEIYELRKVIQKYGEHKKLDGKKIELTDLSSGSHWEVVINELQVKRSKEAPVSYNYTITFTGLSQDISEYTKKRKDSNKKATSIDDLLTDVENIEKNNDLLKLQCLKYFPEISMEKYGLSNRLESLTSKVEDLSKQVNNYASILTGILNTTNLTHLKDVYMSSIDLLKESYRLVFDNAAKIYNSVLDYVLDSTETFLFFKEQIALISDGSLFSPNNLLPGVLDQFKNSTENFADEMNVLLDELETTNDKTMADTKSVCEYTASVIPGTTGEDDELIPIYGYQEKTVKDSDTWESLSELYYGTTDYNGLLAVYNNNVTLKAGAKIYIPVMEESKAINSENLVYNKADIKDNYGIDLKIVNGDLQLQNNDLLSVQGVDNLNQAIDSRLSSEMDSRIRLSVYGIKKAIGKNDVALVFLKNSIEETVLADPRIEEVNNMSVYGVGDEVEVKFIYKDINKNQISFGGRY